MLGMAPFGEFAIGQIAPVIDPPLVGGVRMPLYTPRTPPPSIQASLWLGTAGGYPGGGSAG